MAKPGKNMNKWLVSTLVAMCFCVTAHGQRDGLVFLEQQYKEDPYDELTFFSCGANYLTNNVYLGRKDSLALPYLSPFIGYQLANGVYIKGTASYAPTRKNGHFDLFTLAAGYDRNFGKKVTAGVSVEKYIYHKNSPGIRASLKQSAELYVLYKGNLLEPTLNVGLNMGKSSDYVVGFTLDHNFRLLDNTFNFLPSVTVNAGSQHYYDDYFLTRILKKDKTFPTREIVTNAGQLKPLDVEIAARTTFRTKEWFFTLVPTYAIPLSPASIKLPTRTVKEHLSSSFYVELDICYRHERK